MKPLVILDLNGVLMCRHYTRANGKNRKSRPAKLPPVDYDHVHIEEFEIYLRPGLQGFLDELFQDFSVAVWTSMLSTTVDSFLDHLMDRRQLKFLWCRDRCLWPEEPQGHKTLKPLELVWRNPVVNGDRFFNETNTIIVDDDRTKMKYNPAANVIVIDTFSLKNNNREDDLERLLLVLYRRIRELSE